MIMDEYLLNNFKVLFGVDLFVYEGEKCVYKQVHNPLAYNYLYTTINKQLKKQIPHFYIEDHHLLFIGLKDDLTYICGPISLQAVQQENIDDFISTYHYPTKPIIPLISFHKILEMTKLLCYLICQKEYTSEEILHDNQLSEERIKATTMEKILFDIKEEDEEYYHHTYEEEQKLLDCVREGKVDEAIKLNLKLDEQIGFMSKNDVLQWQKLFTVAITLTARAAIDGGISPAVAYRLSDFYLQKCDTCQDVHELMGLRLEAIRDFVSRVQDKKNRHYHSSYIEQCCSYIEKHYREKIYLNDLAEYLGLSPSYLSKLFASQKGIRLQDYIVTVRVERAANLLRFSDESIARIGDYVNFPSQSYFSKVFKKYMHMTPREYRENFKPKEIAIHHNKTSNSTK